MRDKLSAAETGDILTAVFNIPIRFVDRFDFHFRALELSRELKLPAAYDAHYLALAESEGVDFFTSDQRLYNAAKNRVSWITLVQ